MCTIATAKVPLGFAASLVEERNYNCYNVYFTRMLTLCRSGILLNYYLVYFYVIIYIHVSEETKNEPNYNFFVILLWCFKTFS